ncbi:MULTISPECIES: thioesterase family protein [unclassified Cetobacterium]|uniref:acyl-CoA thioesterase n=1 Tax=unclassified Cetobacterium TaxID=2630983 RepID=UPI000645A709|nr:MULTISPECIES: thioesterase family protein [unclassified Cetobacterium]
MFEIDYKVTVSDINYGGHMGNERALLLFQEARINLFKALGGDEMNVIDGIGTIQKDAHVYYKGEVYMGEKLKVRIVRVELKKASIDFFYQVANENGDIVIEGSTLIVGFNYVLKKISKFPKELFEKLKAII